MNNRPTPLSSTKQGSSRQPPPLPPKPQHKKRKCSVKSETLSSESMPLYELTEDVHEIVNLAKLDSEPILLSRFVEKTSDFPVTVAMKESLYGICGDWSLFEGQLLNIHFQKETEVVSVEIDGGAQYIVPLNSTLQCSILYDPLTNIELAKMGFDFQNVLGIIEAKPMPKVVAVTVDCSPVTKGEILVIKNVQYQENNSEKKQLLCLSVKTGTEKWLNEDCEGCFTTEAEFIKLYLSELIPHVSLPIKATFFDSRETRISLPLNVHVGPCIIDHHRIEKSIVTSVNLSECLQNESPSSSSMEVIEILLMNVSITVQEVNVSYMKKQEVARQTDQLSQEFLPSLVDRVIIDLSPTKNAVQTKLFKAVQCNWTKQTPQKILTSQSRPSYKALMIQQDAYNDDEVYTIPQGQAIKRELISNQLDEEIYDLPKKQTLKTESVTCTNHLRQTALQQSNSLQEYTTLSLPTIDARHHYQPLRILSDSSLETCPSPTQSHYNNVLDQTITSSLLQISNSTEHPNVTMEQSFAYDYVNSSIKTLNVEEFESLKQQVSQLFKTCKELMLQIMSLKNQLTCKLTSVTFSYFEKI